MQIELNKETEQIVQRAISTGKFSGPDEVISAALRLLDSRRHEILESKKSVDELINEGLMSLDAGKGISRNTAREILAARHRDWEEAKSHL